MEKIRINNLRIGQTIKFRDFFGTVTCEVVSGRIRAKEIKANLKVLKSTTDFHKVGETKPWFFEKRNGKFREVSLIS